jgi:hypothetical protein
MVSSVDAAVEKAFSFTLDLSVEVTPMIVGITGG